MQFVPVDGIVMFISIIAFFNAHVEVEGRRACSKQKKKEREKPSKNKVYTYKGRRKDHQSVLL